MPVGRGAEVGGARVVVPRRRRERRARDGVHLARDAVDAEAVGPVRRDLQLEHVVADRQDVGERRARLQGVARAPSCPRGRRRPAPRPRRGSSRGRRRRGAWPSSSFVPSGMTAPGRATPTVCPAATFGAPQTICWGSPSPTSTMQTFSRSASGCCSALSTRPTTKFATSGTPCRCDAVDLGPGHRQARREVADRRGPASCTRAARSAAGASGHLTRTAAGSGRRCRRRAAGRARRA